MHKSEMINVFTLQSHDGQEHDRMKKMPQIRRGGQQKSRGRSPIAAPLSCSSGSGEGRTYETGVTRRSLDCYNLRVWFCYGLLYANSPGYPFCGPSAAAHRFRDGWKSSVCTSAEPASRRRSLRWISGTEKSGYVCPAQLYYSQRLIVYTATGRPLIYA